MSQITPTLLFKYQTQGKIAELLIPIVDGWMPLKLVVDAMGLHWPTQQAALTPLPFVQTVQVPGRRGAPPLCMDITKVPDYLLGLSLARVKCPDIVKHFQTHFPAALGSFIDSTTPKEILLDVPAEVETEQWSKEKVDEFLRNAPIHLDVETTSRDWFRRELVIVGVRDYDEIDYLLRAPITTLYKLNPEKPDGPWLSRPIYIDSYMSGHLQFWARQGYYPIPEFYRRNPSQYEQQTTDGFKIEWGGTLTNGYREVISTTPCRQPAGGAPWNTDAFALKITQRLFLLEELEDLAFRRMLKEREMNGESLLQGVWDNMQDYDDLVDWRDDGWDTEDVEPKSNKDKQNAVAA